MFKQLQFKLRYVAKVFIHIWHTENIAFQSLTCCEILFPEMTCSEIFCSMSDTLETFQFNKRQFECLNSNSDR